VYLMKPALVVVAAYLLGSIPFGYLIVRLKAGADIRATGSGGTGATNVSRSAGKAAGVLTLMLDALKGAAAILLARTVCGSAQEVGWWIALAGLAALLGHIFPIWLGFRGGKGVATGVGVFLMLSPLAVALAAIIFLIIVWSTRYVSLGSILAATSIPLFIWLQHRFLAPVSNLVPLMLLAISGTLLIVFAHRGNIGRLRQGTENKFGRNNQR
jgi:acyl phosphate:glycerol-3-phosphate acyltransferase